MITTDHVTGSPCWIDLGTPDMEAATAFYGAVFGWTLEPGDVSVPGGYGILRLRGRAVAGIAPLTESGARPAWTVYFATADADATAAGARAAGGSVRVAPADVGSEGRFAQLTDPQGGRFAVWQPGERRGLDAVDGPGTLSWVELYTPDDGAALAFYRALFGWETDATPLPEGGGGTYTQIGPAGRGEEHRCGGVLKVPADALEVQGGAASWHAMLGSEDCDAAVARARDNGGTVRMGPEDVPGVGRLAVVLDPSGADFVILTPAG
ncbi:VOC family protein [Streptomyces avicenniae]|uniref:VOC family protein n=1 Tax=Streptomyces avicenniae TaxID=500153 RepID=UPI000699FC37|nr:VOC family protein [Streptomyces avicenniae]